MNNYCTNCGNKINSNDVFCSRCGARLNNYNNNISNQSSSDDDKGGFWWGLLGYFVPVVGLILFLEWKDSKPKNAKAVGKGALISAIVSVVLYIIFFILSLIFTFSSFNNIERFDIPNYDNYDYDYNFE